MKVGDTQIFFSVKINLPDFLCRCRELMICIILF